MHMRRWVLRLTIAYQKARHTGTFETPFVNGSATIQKRDTGQALCSCLWPCARLGPATANWSASTGSGEKEIAARKIRGAKGAVGIVHQNGEGLAGGVIAFDQHVAAGDIIGVDGARGA